MAPKRPGIHDPHPSRTTRDRNEGRDRNDGTYSLQNLPPERPYDTNEPENASPGPADAPPAPPAPEEALVQVGNVPAQPAPLDLQATMTSFSAGLAKSQPNFEEFEASLAGTETAQPPLFQLPSSEFDFSLPNQPAVFQPPAPQMNLSSMGQPVALFEPPGPQSDFSSTGQPATLFEPPAPQSDCPSPYTEAVQFAGSSDPRVVILALHGKVTQVELKYNAFIDVHQGTLDVMESRDDEIERLKEYITALKKRGGMIAPRQKRDSQKQDTNGKDEQVASLTKELDVLEKEGQEMVAEREAEIIALKTEIAKITAERDSIQAAEKRYVEEHRRMIEAKDQEIANIITERDFIQNDEGKKYIEEHHRIIEAKNQEIVNITAERDFIKNEASKLVEEHHQIFKAKDEEIAKMTAELANFNQQAEVYVAAHDQTVEAHKQEIAELNATLKAVPKERDSLDEECKDIDEESREKERRKAVCRGCSEKFEALKMEKNDEILERDRLHEQKIVQLRSRGDQLDADIEGYRERESVQIAEITTLENKLRKANGNDDVFMSAKGKLEKTIEERDTELLKCHRENSKIQQAKVDLQRKLIKLEGEYNSATRFLEKGQKQNQAEVGLIKRIQQLKTSHEAAIAELQSGFDQRLIKQDEETEKTLTLLQVVKEGLEADVRKLQEHVEGSRQKTIDLEKELKEYTSNAATTSETAVVIANQITDHHSPRFLPASDDLGSFSPSRVRAGRPNRLGGSKTVLSADGWYCPPLNRPCFSDLDTDDEDTDEGQQIQQQQWRGRRHRKKGTLSFEEDTGEELPTNRRRRQSTEQRTASMLDASTQTDPLPSASESAIQTQPNNKPAYAEMSTQTMPESKPNGKPAMVSCGTQTAPEDKPAVPASKPPIIWMGTPAIPSKPQSKPAMVSRGTQTKPVKKSNSLCWRTLYYLLCLLAFILFLAMVSHAESNRRERDMWLEANDYTRRAVVSVKAGGGTGMRMPAWFWDDPLIEMPNSYY
ncbi:MAG: hypothetical protein LQ346_002897 [Caloplaca aetnensis]|nr:MAG: hypothetical protein LQ346_002897 [Caloplaca aetnensis]